MTKLNKTELFDRDVDTEIRTFNSSNDCYGKIMQLAT